MKARLGKKNLGKGRSQSGALLDEFDRIDLKDDDNNQTVDQQYEDLIRDSGDYRKTIAAHDFEDDPKYQGVKVSKRNLYDVVEDDEDEDIPSDGDDIDDDGRSIQEEEVQTKGKKKNKGLKDFNVDDMLKDLDAEDQQMVSTQKDRLRELKKARAVKHQQALFDLVIESRVKMQDMLKLANKFPYPENCPIIASTDKSKEIKKGIKEVEVEVVDLLDLLDEISGSYHSKVNSEVGRLEKKRLLKAKQFLRKSNINNKEFIKSYDFDTEQIWKSLDETFEAQVPYIDNIISTWAQKFNILTQNSIKGRFSNIFQTPVQQTQKAMEDYERLSKRTQLRDLSTKPLFELSEASTNYDEENYNDEEFYMTVFREMLQKQAQADAQNAESGDFMVENTRLILKNRQLRTKQKKEVDRRASKNRKIRYDVHAKLMNFMAPVENIILLPGREHILKNLFGLYEKLDDEIAERQKTRETNAALRKKRKKNPQIEEEVEINLL